MEGAGKDLASKFPRLEDIPAQYRLDPPPLDRMYLIDGKVQRWEGACTDIQSPICVQTPDGPKRPIIGQVPAMDESAALEALNCAVRAWSNGRGVWPTMTVADRIGCMEKFVAKMVTVREEVVRLLMWEIGKNLGDSQKEFDRTVEYIRLTIDALKKMDRSSSQFQLDGGVIALVRRSPLGVCLSMGPFNYPLNETYTTLIPALIMGNTIVAKPPKFGGLAHQPLLQAFAECFPPGVVNVIYGVGASIIGPIIKTGKVDVLAFIGTSRAADTLKLQHPRPHRMRSILGLDAKNPAVVLPDADLDVAVKECIAGTLSFNGQRCTAIKLIFVHKDVAEPFVAKFTEAVQKLKLGMPWESGVGITPLPEFNKAATLRAMIDDAVQKGARLVNETGGAACETLVTPAVLFPVSADARVFTEEQFGPVVPITTYSSTEEVLDFVAKSQYGQQVSLFGKDPLSLSKLVDELANQVCRINLNTQCQRGPDTLPFTGRKDSAEGTLSIHDALRCFSIRSLVATPNAPSNRAIVQDIVRGHYSNFLHTDFIL